MKPRLVPKPESEDVRPRGHRGGLKYQSSARLNIIGKTAIGTLTPLLYQAVADSIDRVLWERRMSLVDMANEVGTTPHTISRHRSGLHCPDAALWIAEMRAARYEVALVPYGYEMVVVKKGNML